MKVRAGILVVLFLVSVIPIANADETTPVTINVDWGAEHAYSISGDVDLSEINVVGAPAGFLIPPKELSGPL